MAPTPDERAANAEVDSTAGASASPEQDDAAATGASPEPPGLAESARRLIEEGGETAHAAAATAQALVALARAEFALAHAALRRSFWLGLFAAFAMAAAILYGLAGSVAFLRWLGLPWAFALGGAALLAAVIAGLLYWRARRALRLVRFDATRRQLRRLGEET